MSNNRLQRALEISNKIDSMGVKSAPKKNSTVRVNNPQKLDEMINQYDKQIFGKYEATEEERDKWNADKEINSIKERIANPHMPDVSNRKMPKAIIESILSNPLELDPSVVSDPKMDNLIKNLKKNTQGVESVVSLNEKLEANDRKQINEQLALKPKTETVSTPIDYSTIKMIVEGVLNEKLGMLTERIDRQTQKNNNIQVMAFKNSTFKFLTEDGDVYECQMVYKGKNKKR